MSTFPVDDARRILRTAFIEDVRTGDITCRIVLPPGHRSRARVVAKESGILAGLPLLPLAIEELAALDPDALAGETTWSTPQEDGTPFDAGDTLIELEGPTRAILELERVLLNLLQHLCGVALAAATYQKAAGPTCKVLDTRKTTPGQRTLEKWAIVQGGGSNHRMGLWDAILIKENHVAAVGSARAAACMALASRPEGMDVIAEVRSLEELETLCDLPLTRVLLDNFRPEDIRAARAARDARASSFALEASGGITLGTIASYAQAGAEFVSVGALTHSVKPVDLSLLLEGT